MHKYYGHFYQWIFKGQNDFDILSNANLQTLWFANFDNNAICFTGVYWPNKISKATVFDNQVMDSPKICNLMEIFNIAYCENLAIFANET